MIPALLLACATFFTMPHVVSSVGEVLTVPIIAGPAGGIGLDIHMLYDPIVAQVSDVRLGSAAPDFSMVWNVVSPGHLIVVMYYIYPLKLDGEILLVDMGVLGSVGESTILDLDVVVDEDTIDSCETNGSIRVTK